MIIHKQIVSFLLGSIFVFVLTCGQTVSAAWEEHVFINTKDDRDVVLSTSVLNKAKSYTEEELKEKKLAIGDNEYLVFSFVELGYWLPSSKKFSASIDDDNSAHRNALKRLDELTRKAALENALALMNKEEGSPNTKSELNDLSKELLSRFESLLAPSDGLRRLGARVDRDGVFSNKQFVSASYYYRFNRESLLDEIVPSPIATNFEGPSIDAKDFSSATHYVLRITDRAYAVDKKTRDREAAWKATFDKAIAGLTKEAFKEVLKEVNQDLGDPLFKNELQGLIDKHTRSGQDSYQLYTQNYEIRKQEVVRKNSRDTLHLSIFFYFERDKIKDMIAPAPVVTSFAGPSINPSDYMNEKYHVLKAEDQEFAVVKSNVSREVAWKESYDQALAGLAIAAFKDAIYEVNKSLRYPSLEAGLNQVIQEHTRPGLDTYKLYTAAYHVEKQEVVRAHQKDTLHLSVHFFIERDAIKALITPPEQSIELAVDGADLARYGVPPSNDNEYVAVFKDYTMEVAEDVKDRDAARNRAKDDAMEHFRGIAIRQAAEAINQKLAQPVDSGKFKKVMDKAEVNHSLYISEFKWIKPPLVITRGSYSTAPESLRLSAYFKVDVNALEDVLIEDRAIAMVAQYRAYVEVFWNVPDKEVNREVVMTTVETIEDNFRQAGYEVVEFERIRGDLVELLKAEGEEVEDLYANDELKRFKANLELRNIDKRFESGKRILADYADLLVGVTLNSIEVLDGNLTVRVTTNATLFEKGEWQKLAHADNAMTVPHVPGSTDNLIGLAKKVTLKSLEELEPKVQTQLALRKERKEQIKTTSREFSLVFSGVDKTLFDDIRRRLMKGSKWEYQTADFKQRVVYVNYEGYPDMLSDMVQMYLEGAEIDIGIGEFAAGRNKIIFGQ